MQFDRLIIRRREFIISLGGAVALPLAARAQQPEKIKRIAVLSGNPNDPESQARVAAFRQGLEELKWQEGRNLRFDIRWGAGNADRIKTYAAELVSLAPDLILATNTPTARALKQATTTIPIVFAVFADPLSEGLVASLARPGGNVTGLSLFNPAIVGKQLALINEVVPRAGLVAVLRNPTNSAHVRSLSELEVAARSVQVQLQVFAARKPDEFEPAFAAMTRERARAVLVLGDSMFFLHRARIADFAKRQRLATMSVQREHAEAGGLMAYGANLADIYRRAATYVDKILKGTKPADLPVEQPTKFELVINMKTAKALGLTLPPSILARADEVIQ
jgi:putative tryptophan/tyrosine transport system substrate-binding protein